MTQQGALLGAYGSLCDSEKDEVVAAIISNVWCEYDRAAELLGSEALDLQILELKVPFFFFAGLFITMVRR